MTHQTVDEIVTTVIMMRPQFKGSIILVEGYTDARLFNNFIDKKNCRILPTGNKDKVINCVKKLEEKEIKGVVGIADADFDRIENVNPKNVLLTDTHDAEGMLLRSKALDDFLGEYGNTKEIKKLRKQIRQALIESVVPVGALRLASSPSRLNLGLKFEGIRFENFTDTDTLKTDIRKFAIEVHSITPQCAISTDNMVKVIKETLALRHEPWQLCSGHDLVKILHIGLHNKFGNDKTAGLTPDQVESNLRLAYKSEYFCLTALYHEIKKWETSNTPFKIIGVSCS